VTLAPLRRMLRSRAFVLLTLSFTLQSIVVGLAAHIMALLAADSLLHRAIVANIMTWLMPAATFRLLLAGVGPWLAFLYAFLFGAGNAMMTIKKGTATADLISRKRVGTLNSVMAPPLAMGRAIGPILVATIWDYFNSPTAAVVLTAALGHESRVIDLNGFVRPIKVVSFTYRTVRPGVRGKAKLLLFGQKRACALEPKFNPKCSPSGPARER